MAHYDPYLELGISCDASEFGIGAVLFHHYSNSSKRQITNVPKTLTDTQRRYSQIHEEALAVVFTLKSVPSIPLWKALHLITDHKPLLALFGPSKETPLLAVNRLARWALLLSQYEYSVEFRETCEHGNTDVLKPFSCR